MKEVEAVTEAMEETERFYSENYRRQVSVRETALYAITRFIELSKSNQLEE